MRHWKILLLFVLFGFSQYTVWGQYDSTHPIKRPLEKTSYRQSVPNINFNSPPSLINQFPSPDNSPRGLTYDGTFLWIAENGDGDSWNGPKIYKVDPNTGTVVGAYDHPGKYPCGLAWDGTHLWHSDHGTGMIYKLDRTDLSVIQSFPAPSNSPFDLAYHDGFLYVIIGNTTSIAKIDPADGHVVETIQCEYNGAFRPFGLAAIPNSSDQLMVAEDGNDTSNLFDFDLQRWIDQWSVDPAVYPSGMAYDNDTGRLWVSCWMTNRIYIFNAGGKDVVPIQPLTVDKDYLPGESFWVDITLGTDAEPVTDLRMMGFTLNYTPVNALHLATPHSSHIEGGALWNGDVATASVVNAFYGSISVDLVRTVSGPGITGQGVAARIKFVTSTNLINNTQVYFSLSGFYARNTAGEAILLTGKDHAVTIFSAFDVWPGDSNNDGIVNQADFLPVGVFWQHSGPVRTNASTSWEGQSCPFWAPRLSTYADCDGSGQIDGMDISVILANWNKTHPVSSSRQKRLDDILPKLRIVDMGLTKSKTYRELDIYADEPDDLFGLAMSVSAQSAGDMLTVQFVENRFWGSKPGFIQRKYDEDGTLSIAVIKETAHVNANEGYIARLRIPMKPKESIQLRLKDISGIDSRGKMFPLADIDTILFPTTLLDESNQVKSLAGVHNYPNPFNPTTNIAYHVSQQGHVQLIIYDIHGRIVRQMVDMVQDAGHYTVPWNAAENAGLPVSSGVYICRLVVGSHLSHTKLLFTK